MTRFLMSSLVLAFLIVTLGTGCGGTTKKADVPETPAPPKDAKPGAVQAM